MKQRTKAVIYLSISLIVLAAGIVLWKIQSSSNAEKFPGMGGEFTLQSATGPISLNDFRGKIVLIYFGYTSCPDICPTSLGSLGAALKKLDPIQQQQIQPLFISIDPERDDLKNLQNYAHYFYPGMIGATGKVDYLKTLAQRYGAYFRKVPMENSNLGYSMDHSSTIFVVGKDGRLTTMIQHSNSATKILDVLKHLPEIHD